MSSLLLALVLSLVPRPNATLPENKVDQCFVQSLCELKESIRWKTPKWNEAMCARVGNAIISAERETGISRNLILSLMINESDMNESAQRLTYKNGTLAAWDGGLMGLRCIVDKDGRSCVNYRGRLTYQDLLKPETNVQLAVRKLSTVRSYPCQHRDHPWFAHYNWGGKVLRTGIPRSYPQRVAVLWKALADAQGVQSTELENLRFIQLAGQKRVTISTPVGPRHRDLVSKIWACKSMACRGSSVVFTGPPVTLAAR
jgi:hypothetical protein